MKSSRENATKRCTLPHPVHESVPAKVASEYAKQLFVWQGLLDISRNFMLSTYFCLSNIRGELSKFQFFRIVVKIQGIAMYCHGMYSINRRSLYD